MVILSVNVTNATYGIMEQLISENLNPMIGNDPFIAGFIMLLILVFGLTIFGLPMEITLTVGIAFILLVASTSNFFTYILATGASVLAIYIFVKGMMKLIDRFGS